MRRRTGHPRVARVKSGIRVLWLTAFFVAVGSPRLFADVSLVSRLSDARASATHVGASNIPPPQIQTDFLPANLTNSANVGVEQGYAIAHCSSHSSIANDQQMGTVQITGDGTAHTEAWAFSGQGTGTASAKLITISFTLIGSCSYSLGGQLSAQHIDGTSSALAKLTGSGGTIFQVVANQPPAVTLSENGILQPDDYTLTVELNAFSQSTNTLNGPPDSICDSSGNFSFVLGTTLTQTPTPTPSPTATVTPSATPSPSATGTPADCGALARISGSVSNCSAPLPTATPPASPTPPPPVPVADVLITASGGFSYSTSTDLSGNYSLTVGAGFNTHYTITPSKGPLAAGSGNINTTDVLAVQRHFLGLAMIPTGCRLNAADVVIDGSINTQDVIAIQRFYLGLTSGIGSAGQYKFVPANRSVFVSDCSVASQNNFNTYVVGDVVAPFVSRPEEVLPDAATENEVPKVATVMLPDVAADQSNIDFTTTVRSSAIDGRDNFVGFQGDFTFDERVIRFSDEPVQNAGLTAGNWIVAGNVLPGLGPMRTLRISAFSNDFAPLAGEGILFALRISRVSAGTAATQLMWAAPPDNFIFIDADLKTQKPGYAAPGRLWTSGKRR